MEEQGVLVKKNNFWVYETFISIGLHRRLLYIVTYTSLQKKKRKPMKEIWNTNHLLRRMSRKIIKGNLIFGPNKVMVS